MVTLNRNVVRMAVDTLSFDAPKDDIRQQLVQFWRCNDLEFQIGIFSENSIVDISNFASLYLSLRALNEGNPPSGGEPSLMLGIATAFDSSLTEESWNDGSKQHAKIIFSAADNAQEAGEYWMSLWGITSTDQHIVTLGSGVCKILENGGISSVPPEPKKIYYTAQECDVKLSNHYTKIENDQQLSNYYSKSITDEKLRDYSLKTETDSILQNYCTLTECDAKVGDSLQDYYTAVQCDNKFALLGSGGGGLAPIQKGELVIGNGTSAALLAGGATQQVLIANPNAEKGAEWSHYPWNLIEEYKVSEPVAEIDFDDVFDVDKFWHYKLSYNFISTSEVGAQLRMIYGYKDNSDTIWETSPTEYSYNTSDFSGTVAKYALYSFVNGYFGFGNDDSIYRNVGGTINGEMDIWNNGDVAHHIQAHAYTSSYRIYNASLMGNGGIYNFIYRNVGMKAICSLKLFLATGTFLAGRISLYGIR